MMRKTRRTYVQPAFEVVELHVTNQLLQASASGGLDSPSDYDGDTDPFANS